MKRKAYLFLLSLAFALSAGSQNVAAQARKSWLEEGLHLYRAGYWSDAALELRRFRTQAANVGEAAEALYWLSLAEFALGDYTAALWAIDELQRIAPAGLRIDNILYYKARALYYLNRSEEALTAFRLYESLLDRSKGDTLEIAAERTTLAYWMGECLYALGRYEEATKYFTIVISASPKVEQYEAASYRLTIIQQNELQKEIVGMLDWSYSEYLRLAEEYQGREAAFNETIDALQKAGIAGSATSAFELEDKIEEYRRLLGSTVERIQTSETQSQSPATR